MIINDSFKAKIDSELGAEKENILFDALKYGTSFKVLNSYFDWKKINYHFKNEQNISLFSVLFHGYMHSLSILKSPRAKLGLDSYLNNGIWIKDG